MRFLTKILNHFCRGCGTLLSADERQTGLCSSCWFEKEKKQSLVDILPRMNAGDSRISRFGFLFDTTKQEGRGR